MDAAAQCDDYASDITRTAPVAIPGQLPGCRQLEVNCENQIFYSAYRGALILRYRPG